MSIKFNRILPNTFQSVAVFILAIFVIVLGNTKQILHYYGLNSSTQVIHNTTSSAITSGLGRLDNFQATAGLVTFGIWAVIGLFCFSIVQMIVRVYRGLEEDEALSSNRYVHPATFVRKAFWKGVLGDFVGLILSVLLLAVVCYLFVGYGLAISLADTRLFLHGVSVARIGDVLLGFVLLYAWLLVITSCLKLVFNRRKLFS